MPDCDRKTQENAAASDIYTLPKGPSASASGSFKKLFKATKEARAQPLNL
jgi:hypothetical protein